METALFALVALACPIGMLLMGAFMWKGTRSKRESQAPASMDEPGAAHANPDREGGRIESAQSGAGVTTGER